MYEISGKIYEQHGEYKAYLEVWIVEGSSKSMLYNAYEVGISSPQDAILEHETVDHILLTVLRRNAEHRDVPLV